MSKYKGRKMERIRMTLDDISDVDDKAVSTEYCVDVRSFPQEAYDIIVDVLADYLGIQQAKDGMRTAVSGITDQDQAAVAAVNLGEKFMTEARTLILEWIPKIPDKFVDLVCSCVKVKESGKTTYMDEPEKREIVTELDFDARLHILTRMIILTSPEMLVANFTELLEAFQTAKKGIDKASAKMNTTEHPAVKPQHG